MDELKDKLKNMFGKSQAKGAFKGKANVLGSASTQSGAPPPRQVPGPASAPQPVIRVPPPSAATGVQPAMPAYPLTAGVSQSISSAQQQQHLPTAAPAASKPPAAATAAPSASLPQQQASYPAAPQQQPSQHQAEAAPEALSLAMGQLASDPNGAVATAVIEKLLGNIVSEPGDPKFRRVRLTNPRIQSAVVDVGGGLELLLACGFEIVFEETTGAAAANREAGSSSGSGDGTAAAGASEQSSSEGYAVLAEDADLQPLRHAIRLLAPLRPTAATGGASLAASTAAGRSSASEAAGEVSHQQQRQRQQQQRQARLSQEWEPPRERNTQVLLPTSVERDVPEWFFQRNGQELKAAFMSAARRREQDQVLMTRAMRERLRGKHSQAPATYAVVKVRFPEGISLQGEFGAGEPVAAVFAWVAHCLNDPLHTYELVLPSRQPLEPKAQTVRQADLLPSVALLFRWTGQSAAEMANVPALRSELLHTARPATASY